MMSSLLLLLLSMTTSSSSTRTYVRCNSNPLAKAGFYHSDKNLFETSIGDPDIHYDNKTQRWHIWWSTGLATTYATPMMGMGIKHGYSTDGVNFTVRKNSVLETGSDSTAWDFTKAETPTVIRLPAGIATPQRQWLMLYSGGNDQAARPPGVSYTWYQLGAAFSSNGEEFQKLPAAESPYANATKTPYGNGSLEGLVLLGRDAFPGVAGVVDGLAADPELIVDPDGKTLHVFFSSGAVDNNGDYLVYGISHATSIDGGVNWLPSIKNPVLLGPRGPSVIQTISGWQLFFLQDSSTDIANIPTTFNPELGVWAANASSLLGPWQRLTNGSGIGGREVSWNANAPAEALGWIATGDMAQHAPNGEKRWYYVGFDPTTPIPNGWVAPVHPTKAYPLGLEPAIIALSMMYQEE